MIVLLPKEGFVTNPFHTGKARNKLCVCLSGKKVKKCHGALPYIEKELLEKLMLILEANAATEQSL